MDLKTWELRSPAELIDMVSEQVPLVEGAVYAVLVIAPSTRQHVQKIERIDAADPRDAVDDLRERWGSTLGRRDDHLVVTVVVRRGICGFGATETPWSRAWHLGHVTALSGGAIMVVTEHGWWDLLTDHADHRPALGDGPGVVAG